MVIWGGVTVYQRNVLAEMSKRDDGGLYFMNSGFLYDNKGLRIMKTVSVSDRLRENSLELRRCFSQLPIYNAFRLAIHLRSKNGTPRQIY